MKNFIKDNWFKIILAICAIIITSVYFYNGYYIAKQKHNIDVADWCAKNTDEKFGECLRLFKAKKWFK